MRSFAALRVWVKVSGFYICKPKVDLTTESQPANSQHSEYILLCIFQNSRKRYISKTVNKKHKEDQEEALHETADKKTHMGRRIHGAGTKTRSCLRHTEHKGAEKSVCRQQTQHKPQTSPNKKKSPNTTTRNRGKTYNKRGGLEKSRYTLIKQPKPQATPSKKERGGFEKSRYTPIKKSPNKTKRNRGKTYNKRGGLKTSRHLLVKKQSCLGGTEKSGHPQHTELNIKRRETPLPCKSDNLTPCQILHSTSEKAKACVVTDVWQPPHTYPIVPEKDKCGFKNEKNRNMCPTSATQHEQPWHHSLRECNLVKAANTPQTNHLNQIPTSPTPNALHNMERPSKQDHTQSHTHARRHTHTHARAQR